MERIIFEREPGGDAFELRAGALPAAAGVLGTPSPREVARAISSMGGDWFLRFLTHLAKESPNRAYQVAEVTEVAGLLPHRSAMDDVRGGDIDPGFGVDQADSGLLLELRNAIDEHLGWFCEEDKERGDYTWRVRQVGRALQEIKGALRW